MPATIQLLQDLISSAPEGVNGYDFAAVHAFRCVGAFRRFVTLGRLFKPRGHASLRPVFVVAIALLVAIGAFCFGYLISRWRRGGVLRLMRREETSLGTFLTCVKIAPHAHRADRKL